MTSQYSEFEIAFRLAGGGKLKTVGVYISQ